MHLVLLFVCVCFFIPIVCVVCACVFNLFQRTPKWAWMAGTLGGSAATLNQEPKVSCFLFILFFVSIDEQRVGGLIKTTASGGETIAFLLMTFESLLSPIPTHRGDKEGNFLHPSSAWRTCLPDLLTWVTTELRWQLERDFGVHLALSSFQSFTENISVTPNIVGYQYINPVMETLQIIYKKQIINMSKSSALLLVVDVFNLLSSQESLYNTHLLKIVSGSCILKGQVKYYQKSRNHQTF